uniref:Immunoglobulin domain-containing protein n=1 Tax=Sinocyclocheilus grahami TaxID=75366 RepID=A0A672MN64_SINGR
MCSAVLRNFSMTISQLRLLLLICISEMKLMSVKEGDPVILQTDIPQLYRDELIVWRFGDEGKLIAKHDIEAKSSPLYYETDERFRDRLQLNHQTGSLIITNTRTTDSGHYKVKISSNKQTLYQKYIVTVSGSGLSPGVVVGIVVVLVAAAAAGVISCCHKIAEIPETVSGMEGDDVKLNTGVTKIQTGDLIEWQSGNEDSLIAQIKGETSEITTYDDVLHGIFRDRLKLDKKTGSLTITNTRIEHTGPYKLLINNKYKRTFIVYIREIMKEICSLLYKTKTEIQTGDEIRWLFGSEDTLVAEIKGEKREMTTHDDPDGRFRDRLELVEANGSLTIKNITADHAGLYKLLILSRGRTLCSKFFVYVKGEYLKSEGDPVILQTDVPQLTGDELIVWRFGDEGKLIAKADIEAKSSSLYDTDERFRDRLQLNDQTVSLTITNTRTTDSGLYTAKISSNKQTLYKRFIVTVSAKLTMQKKLNDVVLLNKVNKSEI